MTRVEAALVELKELAQVSLACRYLDDFQPCAPEWEAREWRPAASVIKVAIMAALLDAAEQGEVRLEERLTVSERDQVGGAGVLLELEPGHQFRLDELCRLMMVVSDNTASNLVAHRLGRERLHRFWQSRGYQCRMERDFMSPVGPQGEDNQMSALAASEVLRDLYLGRDLSPPRRDFAVGCLRRQQYREKIPRLLPPEVSVGHKTGELDGVRHDAAVVESDRPFILTVFTSRGKDPWQVDEAVARLALAVYEHHLQERQR